MAILTDQADASLNGGGNVILMPVVKDFERDGPAGVCRGVGRLGWAGEDTVALGTKIFLGSMLGLRAPFLHRGTRRYPTSPAITHPPAKRRAPTRRYAGFPLRPPPRISGQALILIAAGQHMHVLHKTACEAAPIHARIVQETYAPSMSELSELWVIRHRHNRSVLILRVRLSAA